MKKTFMSLLLVMVVLLSCCACNDTTVTTDTESWVEGGGVTTDVSNENSEGNSNGSSNDNSNGSSNDNSNGNQNTNIKNPFAPDLKGATITVYQGNASFSSFLVTNQDTKSRKSYQEILNKVQKELNCKFEVKSVTEEKLKSLMTTSAASGKSLCNIATTRMYNLGYYVSAGILADMTRISSMDLSKDYMNRLNVLEASSIGGAKYAVCSEDGRRADVTIYNKRILKEMGYKEDYLYKLVDSKKWNYTICRSLCREAMKDIDGKSGMSEADQWGAMIVSMSTMGTNCVTNNGGAFLKYDNDGYLVYNMMDDRNISAINLISDFYNEGTTCKLISNWQDRISAFANGKSLFCFQTLEHVATVASESKDEFGVLPVPMIDGNSNYNTALDWNADVIMVPAGQSAAQQYNSGAVIQALLSLCGENAKVYKNEMAVRYLCDDESLKCVEIAIDSCRATTADAYCDTNPMIKDGTYRPMWNTVEGGASLLTGLESTKNSTIKALEELNATAKKNKS